VTWANQPCPAVDPQGRRCALPAGHMGDHALTASGPAAPQPPPPPPAPAMHAAQRVAAAPSVLIRRFVIVIVSIIAGYAFAIFLDIGLQMSGINIPASMARTYSEYGNYSAVQGLVLTVFFSWAMYQGLARRFLERKVDDRPFLERLPSSVRHPSAVGLVIAWVVAVFTAVVYPVAIYMSWRFYVQRRDGESKVCPRCARNG
jgi:hypothetical protein